MTDFETRVLSALERIADALESAAPKPKVVKPKADLFEINEERAVRGKRPARVMPVPFPMTDNHLAFAAKHGMRRDVAEFQFSRFKSHHGAKGSVFASWDQAWQTWVLNQQRFSGTAPQSPRPSGGMDGRI